MSTKKKHNLGKLYLLPKIHKTLLNEPGRPVISNCGTPTEKVSVFLDHHLKPIMQKGLSYIRDSQHFLDKKKLLEVFLKMLFLSLLDYWIYIPTFPIKQA